MPRGAWRLASPPARRRRRLEGSLRPVPRTPRTARPDRRAAPCLCALPRHQVGHWEGRDPRAGPAPSGQAPGRPWGSAFGGAGETRRPGSPCVSLTGERSWDFKRAARKPRSPNGQSAVSPRGLAGRGPASGPAAARCTLQGPDLEVEARVGQPRRRKKGHGQGHTAVRRLQGCSCEQVCAQPAV